MPHTFSNRVNELVRILPNEQRQELKRYANMVSKGTDDLFYGLEFPEDDDLDKALRAKSGVPGMVNNFTMRCFDVVRQDVSYGQPSANAARKAAQARVNTADGLLKRHANKLGGEPKRNVHMAFLGFVGIRDVLLLPEVSRVPLAVADQYAKEYVAPLWELAGNGRL